ncbi:esterase-like activity of phytase family protein [Solitalea sp. MAHUQ-68]|uniref:Esterase-like activity of phytase family protein n=1 Tax=Solitalea agri TaxID=2953739 RepID=A0A9X2EZ39_9SPHI|nr:esterase-like activity of phytase family protein [Solitalea agri]MCO4291612.1 esterase-like activity of phytase family protein [Solitalea agri]
MNKTKKAAYLTLFAAIALTIIFISCRKNLYINDPNSRDTTQTTGWRFIGEQILPNDLTFQNTSVGGLSGIDYDPASNLYYLICDDRSEKQAARFYTAKLYFKPSSFDSVTITGVTSLKQPDGTTFPNKYQDKFHVPDPESIRFVKSTGNLLWSSEGERKLVSWDTILIDPFLREMKTDGSFIGEYPIPEVYKMYKKDYGMRQNSALESISLSPDEQFIFTANEEPLFQDGPQADTEETKSFIRITKINRLTKEIVAQYAYKLDKVHASPLLPGGFKVNGVDEILSITENKMYVMERSFAVGAFPSNSIRIYEVDLEHATNVKDVDALAGRQFTPATKKLAYNLASLNTSIDNVEGITFGPKLPNGNKTLVLVSDNNFTAIQKTQFLVFELLK